LPLFEIVASARPAESAFQGGLLGLPLPIRGKSGKIAARMWQHLARWAAKAARVANLTPNPLPWQGRGRGAKDWDEWRTVISCQGLRNLHKKARMHAMARTYFQ
jgi:hypothetical protein